MKSILKAVQASYLPYIILTLLTLGCAPDPLTRGSVALKKNPTPLGYTQSGQPLLIEDFSGSPFILYVKSRWCPLCKRLDATLEEGILSEGEMRGVSFPTLELIDRKVLDKSGVSVMTPATKETGSFILDLPSEEKNSLHFLGDSGRARKILKLRRIPALIGFNRKGQVAGILYGYQSEMHEKINNLLDLVLSEEFEVKGKNGF